MAGVDGPSSVEGLAFKAVSACESCGVRSDECSPLRVLSVILDLATQVPNERIDFHLLALQARDLPVECWILLTFLGFKEEENRLRMASPLDDDRLAALEVAKRVVRIASTPAQQVSQCDASPPDCRPETFARVSAGWDSDFSLQRRQFPEPCSPTGIAAELKDFGFGMEDISAAIDAALSSGAGLSLSSVANVLVKKEAPRRREAEKWQCPICFDDKDDNARAWACPRDHRFCLDCMQGHVAATTFPVCPATGCGYKLQEDDLVNVGTSPARLRSFQAAQLNVAMDTLAAPGEVVVRCSERSCTYAALLREEKRIRFRCRRCPATPFCTQCRQTPFHYHEDCGSVQPLREQWLKWTSGGRQQYFGLKKQATEKDQRRKALLDGIARHNELLQDEQWKTQHCRLCPHCGRPVEKVDGCDRMKCGENYHGGDRQQGCGQQFDWGTAKPYAAHIQRKEVPDLSKERVQVRGRHAFHPFSKCSLCQRGRDVGIFGLRFKCIHCPTFEVCQDCEPILEDPSVHAADHVFRIHFEGELRLPWLPVQQQVCICRDCTGKLPESMPVAQGMTKPALQLKTEELEGSLGHVVENSTDGSNAVLVELDDGRGHVCISTDFLEPCVKSRHDYQKLLQQSGLGFAPEHRRS
mmetsp:Transcript_37580/g.86849  ORF Transcript_37580/g.86849 Transcript_37580/m.86849 type:complete len:640 (+) Transcript_37580:57-1976(+)